jgi:hypothetical protein
LSGKRRAARGGQLATLDAIVFFSASILVSSVLLTYGIEATETTETKPTRNPANLLEVFLMASIGVSMNLDLGERAVIRSNEQIGDCLSIELRGLSQGLPEEAFLPLNHQLSIVLQRLCGLSVVHRLVVLDHTSEEVLAIGMDIDRSARNVFASSIDLGDIDGKGYLVMLVISTCVS